MLNKVQKTVKWLEDSLGQLNNLEIQSGIEGLTNILNLEVQISKSYTENQKLKSQTANHKDEVSSRRNEEGPQEDSSTQYTSVQQRYEKTAKRLKYSLAQLNNQEIKGGLKDYYNDMLLN